MAVGARTHRPQRPQTQGRVIVLAQSFKQGCLKSAALSCHTMWQPKRLTRHDAKPTEQARRARMHDSGRTESLHDAATQTTAIRHPATLSPAQQAGYYFWCGGWENPQLAGKAWRPYKMNAQSFARMRNQQSKHDVQGCTIAVAQSRRKDAPTQTTAIRQPRHTFARSTSGVLFLVRWEGEPATCG